MMRSHASPSGGPFKFEVILTGMAPADRFSLELSPSFSRLSIGQLMDRVFPGEDEARREIELMLDRVANPDLPEIFAVFLAVTEEWRQGRCLLTVFSGEDDEVELSNLASTFIEWPKGADENAAPIPLLKLHVEQVYRAVNYGARSEFWNDNEELLDWLRSMTILYFMDKYEEELPATPQHDDELVLSRLVYPLLEDGLVGESEEGSTLEISEEGRDYIGELLSETESYIDLYDHFNDTLMDPEIDSVEFGTGDGFDLRVQVYIAEGLDPVRTVFLLRLYDGTLDGSRWTWRADIQEEEFFDRVLEPVVNRYHVEEPLIDWVIDHWFAHLEEQQEEAREQESRKAVRRRVRRSLPES